MKDNYATSHYYGSMISTDLSVRSGSCELISKGQDKQHDLVLVTIGNDHTVNH